MSNNSKDNSRSKTVPTLNKDPKNINGKTPTTTATTTKNEPVIATNKIASKYTQLINGSNQSSSMARSISADESKTKQRSFSDEDYRRSREEVTGENNKKKETLTPSSSSPASTTSTVTRSVSSTNISSHHATSTTTSNSPTTATSPPTSPHTLQRSASSTISDLKRSPSSENVGGTSSTASFIKWVKDRKKIQGKGFLTMSSGSSPTLSSSSSNNGSSSNSNYANTYSAQPSGTWNNSSSSAARRSRVGRVARQFTDDELKQLENEISTSTVVTITMCKPVSKAKPASSKKQSTPKTILLIKMEIKKGHEEGATLFRNYQHFAKLHSKLEESFPAFFKELSFPRFSKSEQPTWPPKSDNVKKDLQEYLDRIMTNEDIVRSPALRNFLNPLERPLRFSLGNVIKEGVLKLNGGLIGGWSEKYVVVKDKRLYYFKDSDGYSVPAGYIRLDYCVIDIPANTKEFCFDLKSWIEGKEYNFKAKEEQERAEWVKVLRIEKAVYSPSPKNSVKEIQPEFSDLLMEYVYSDKFNTPTTPMSPGDIISTTESPGIIFEDDSSSNFLMNQQKQQIKGGTVEKLLEKLTEEQQEMDYVLCFLLTYRSFTTPQVLLSTCLQRFRSPPVRALGESEEKKQLHPTQLRVCTILSKWVEVNFSDFNDDDSLTKTLINFIENDLSSNPKFQNMGKKLREVIKKKVVPKKNRAVTDSIPEPELPYCFDGIHFDIIDIPPIEVARQLTLIEFELYKKIQPKECLKVKDKEKQAPNLYSVIKRFNAMNRWIVTEITTVPELKARAALLGRFIEIALACMSLNNYNSAMEILSALNSSSVFRLQKTWDALPSSLSSAFARMKEQLSSDNNYKLYRESLHTKQPPCVPYFGVYLTDLTFVEDGMNDKLEKGLVNFDKNYSFYRVIKEILLYQQTEYSFRAVEEIKEFLLTVDGLEDSESYNLSLRVEPREATC